MTQPPAGWHADPFRRFHLRYWDGDGWTEHVASNGLQSVDPPVEYGQPLAPQPSQVPTWEAPMAERASTPQGSQPLAAAGPAGPIQRQLQQVGLASPSREPVAAILNESVLVINQKGKLVELRAEYAIYNQHGVQLGAVRGKRMSSRVQVIDMQGLLLLDLRREASLVSSKVILANAAGAKIGRIVPSVNVNQRDRKFKLEGAQHELLGGVYSEDSHPQRHRDFNVQDTNGNLVGRISKTHAGLAKELFTKGDNYVVTLSDDLPQPLRRLAIGAALVIDTTFHQK